jgi:AraC-like DNA-binding protein
MSTVFPMLKIGATLRDETGWYAVHVPEISTIGFEFAHGLAPERYVYNDRSVARARRERRPLLTEHAGFSDIFVPLATGEDMGAVLVTGPFATRRPTSADVLERWKWLTGHQGHPSDPEFARYLSLTLATVTLEGELLTSYERWLGCYARMIAGQGDAHTIAVEATKLQGKLQAARFVDDVWTIARSMVDEQTGPEWLSPHSAIADFPRLGIDSLPDHVLVGLTVGRRTELDAVAEVLSRDSFQRTCVGIARRRRMLCGRIADHGVMFLLNGPRGRGLGRILRELAEEVGHLGRRHGLAIHFGASAAGGPTSLSARYDQALRAAERALTEGARLVTSDPHDTFVGSRVRQHRLRLASAQRDQPSALLARFEQYLEAVAHQAGYRIESARTHLEVGFDQVAQGFLATGVLSERSYLDAGRALERRARDAATISDLFVIYRSAIADLVALASRPTRANQDHNLRRAISFIHEHFNERLTLSRVARIAGFAPRYFSRLFRHREKMTLDEYVRRLRLDRAKQLLKVTDLSVERVSQLCGFSLRPYFYRVFTEAVGMTPVEYRRKPLETPPDTANPDTDVRTQSEAF